MPMLYSSADITVSWNGINLSSGWADDTFLTIEPTSERKMASFGSDGQMTISKMANKGATITLTLKQTSDTNLKIAALAAAEDAGLQDIGFAPFIVLDKTNQNEVFFADNAVLTEIPGNEYGAEVGEKAWTWTCETYISADNLSGAASAVNTIKARFIG